MHWQLCHFRTPKTKKLTFITENGQSSNSVTFHKYCGVGGGGRRRRRRRRGNTISISISSSSKMIVFALVTIHNL